MMAKESGTVRIGPITLFTLIAVICLSVMAVLTVTTANALFVMTQRQASSVTDEYLLETTAQTFVSGVDASLSEARTASGTTQASEVAAVSSQLDSLVATAKKSGVTCDAKASDTAVIASFSTSSGHRLNVQLTISNSGTYTIDKWQMSTDQTDAGTGDTLWSGTTS